MLRQSMLKPTRLGDFAPDRAPSRTMVAPKPHEAISSRPFGKAPNGAPVELFILRNHHGMEARIATYGGIVTHLTAPDRTGHFADVVLGYDTLDEYLRS